MGEPHFVLQHTVCKMASQDDQKVLFVGRGQAVLTILDFNNWKDFLKRDGRNLTPEEIVDIECATSFDNYQVDGKIKVEWPEVTVEFIMDRFLGRKKGSKGPPMIISATQNFATIIHPFAVDKEWFKGLNNKDVKRFQGFEWVFEQNKDDFLYKGHIRKGREMFVTFNFGPDRRFHKYQGK